MIDGVRFTDSDWTRFWSKVDATGDCWEWTAHRNHNGYGKFRLGGRAGGMRFAHRVSLALTLGRWPHGDTDHLCRNRGCVNPAHLDDVTHQENGARGAAGAVRRIKAAQITHCPQGHPYSEGNVYVRKTGARKCRACERARAAERRARRASR